MKQADDQIHSVMAVYFSGKATQDERAQLISWVESDKANYDYFMQLKNLWEVSRPAFDLQGIDTEEALKNINRKIDAPDRCQISWMYYWQRIAAVLIIPLLGLSVYLYLNIHQLSDDSTISFQEVFAPYGTRSFLELPDGSKVWLNAGSLIKYPVQFKKGERSIFLQGEAYFEIESDSRNPFLVRTNHLTVKATGTAFNVEAYDTDSISAVTLVHGMVDISFARQKDSVLPLTPGEHLNYNSITSSYNKGQTQTYKWCAWKDGKMVFRDDPLEYVFKRLGQTFNVDIEFKDKGLANHPYRATFENESLDEILRLLKMTAPITYKQPERTPIDNDYHQRRKIEVYRIKE